jgi:type IV fimbrial biogenesis protein FimT
LVRTGRQLLDSEEKRHMLIRRPAQRGVTLIELLIGFVLIGILTVMAVPAYQGFMRNAEIRNTAETLANGIQTARVEAIRRNALVQIILGPGTGWTIQLAATGDQIEQHPDAVGTGSAAVVLNDLDNDWVTDDADADRITFNGMGWRVPNSDSSPVISRLDVHNSAAGTCQHDVAGKLRCLRLVVSGGGGSKMCDPAAAAGDPRACP